MFILRLHLFDFFRTLHTIFSFFGGFFTELYITSIILTKLTEFLHSILKNHEQSPLPPGREDRSFETESLAATALEVSLKSMRGPCAGRFFCGKSFSSLPADKVTSASVSTLAAILTSL